MDGVVLELSGGNLIERQKGASEFDEIGRVLGSGQPTLDRLSGVDKVFHFLFASAV